MRYTQGQIRELLSISVDAFRTWRDAIPGLVVHKGHAPSFTPGDVVAMAVVGELVRDFGVRVGTLGARFDQLFRECRDRTWLSLERCVVIIEADGIRLVDTATEHRLAPNASTINVPCAPIVAHLRAALTVSEVEQVQGYLQFPPTVVSTQGERHGKRA